MKKIALIGAIVCTTLLVACAAKPAPAQEPGAAPVTTAAVVEVAPQSTAAPAGTGVPQETAALQKTVTPLPATLDVNDLTDCTFPASFQASDAYLNDDGAFVVHLTVYDYELFDLVDISQLAVGDTLVIGGATVTVESLERVAGGWVEVNGGFDQGGYTLATNEDGVYFAVEADDMKQYRALGEATLRVGQDFTLVDDSDLEQPGRISYAGDFLMDMEKSDRSFSPDETTVTVEGGFITHIAVVYTP